MVKDILYEPYELALRGPMTECPRGDHKHTFFEMVYVVSGTGRQRINNARFPYKAGHLFLLAPEDAHRFDIETPTVLFFIRFNNIYLQADAHHKELLQRLELILKNASLEPGCILKNEQDKHTVKAIMQAMISEYQNDDLYHKELVAQFINTLLVIAARNIVMSLPEKIDEQSQDKVLAILQYVQMNIYNPEKLKAEHISSRFGISESYLGRYFRRQTNETLQQYILNYKLKLIENRLLHTDMRITEIADEFGFTDKSHLARLFKKYKGTNPGDFRKNGIKNGAKKGAAI
ncbi:AraC family transcriptional regulator [Chitinophagaceae bacterium MMS25-I14]